MAIAVVIDAQKVLTRISTPIGKDLPFWMQPGHMSSRGLASRICVARSRKKP